MKHLSTIVVGLLAMFSLAANAGDYKNVDVKVRSYPTAFASPDKLAAHISKDFYREEDKARALFTWMAHNIKYDPSPNAAGRRNRNISYSSQAERSAKIEAADNELAIKTLRSRKGVCNGYATLYKVTAEEMGLKSEIIYGSAKNNPAQIGKGPSGINHAWNAVRINGVWKLLDVTWGAGGFAASAGSGFDDSYFFTSPDLFFMNHFPENENWLLTSKTVSEFAALPLVYNLNYQLVSPVMGIIITGTGEKTLFKIKGFKATDEVMYQYTSAAFANKVFPKINDGAGEFNLVLGDNAKGTLTIFVNKKPLVSYKLTAGN
ncbi:hypothetical protein LRS05_11710 [Flavobacterium sp. J372]|uniref:transglutaminase domain-containing protein n=1 Tax=Flavobacterium sp. J372 TaxID=2898436 RepID=UPI002150D5CD|nr:transglutaminase domain-containing protein [Flavobacterium sp. J372]MCR5862762.1 hypothetical protein [Flavobacterium sp. J372]